MNKVASALLTTLLAIASLQAHAGLLGSTVNTQYYSYGSTYNSGGSPASFVANGTAQNQFFNYYTLTITDNQVIYNYLSNTTWSPSATSLNQNGLFITNGNLLTFSGVTISSVTLDPASAAAAGFSSANVTFNANSIAVDWQNVNFQQGDKVIFDVNAAPVPEPESYALMLAGLGVIGFAARRRHAV